MVIHPFSPPILPSDYPHMYSSPPSTSSQTSSSSPRKRKREFDAETEYFDNNHILKKQRDEFITAPLTPTSPPLSTLQRLTPPSDHEDPYVSIHSQSHNNNNNSNSFPAASYVTYIRQENNKSHSSDALGSIPDTNRFLRDLHLTARAHQSARKQEDEGMWEEEEEMVSDRYSEMNKLLGSRRQHW